jgi:hypothetical protein
MREETPKPMFRSKKTRAMREKTEQEAATQAAAPASVVAPPEPRIPMDRIVTKQIGSFDPAFKNSRMPNGMASRMRTFCASMRFQELGQKTIAEAMIAGSLRSLSRFVDGEADAVVDLPVVKMLAPFVFGVAQKEFDKLQDRSNTTLVQIAVRTGSELPPEHRSRIQDVLDGAIKVENEAEEQA